MSSLFTYIVIVYYDVGYYNIGLVAIIFNTLTLTISKNSRFETINCAKNTTLK